MSHTLATAAPVASFPVRCSYCRGEHVASLDTAPYGGQVNGGYGVLYGVHCTVTGIRYGLHDVNVNRIH